MLFGHSLPFGLLLAMAGVGLMAFAAAEAALANRRYVRPRSKELWTMMWRTGMAILFLGGIAQLVLVRL